MYFDLLLWSGLIALAGAIAWTGSIALALWSVLLLSLFVVQRRLPFRDTDFGSMRAVFGGSIVGQWVLACAAAVLTDRTGMWVILFGQTLNAAVILINDLRMPVLDWDQHHPTYRDADEHTHLWWLGDVFPTSACTWARWVVSPGDALEVIGLWVLSAELILGA